MNILLSESTLLPLAKLLSNGWRDQQKVSSVQKFKTPENETSENLKMLKISAKKLIIPPAENVHITSIYPIFFKTLSFLTSRLQRF